MSNLGDYQLFAVAAKAAGGVPNYVASIERAAVLKKMPVMLTTGVGAGIALTIAGRKFWDQRRAAQQEAEAAKRQLASALDDDGLQSGTDIDPASF